MKESLEFALPMLYPGSRAGLEERMEYSERMLLRALDGGKTVAILGSGISKAFGYPSWPEFARDLLDETKAALTRKGGSPPELDDIKSFQAAAKRSTLDANALMFLIGACRSALEQNDLAKVYKRFIKKHFAAGIRQPAQDPFEVLLRLPILRFVTTNYDCEIEQALVKYRSACPVALGIQHDLELKARLGRASFTQLNGSERLVRFSLADVDNQEAEVFHCHGRHDDLKSIVASELDYQNLYLESRAGGPLAFQQLIGLLLGSNPLLFIGYGLGDEDLLRPLRQLGLLDPAQKTSRPIFALFPCAVGEAEKVARYKHAAFQERFGLHVLSYPRRDPDDPTPDLYDKLQRIERSLRREHRGRGEKPKLRPACSPVSAPTPHCEIDLAAAQVPSKPWPELTAAIETPGVVLLIGPSGSGKSNRLLDLVRNGEAHGFAGSFYWNAHYANEAVTALDTALSYLDPRREYRGTRYSRLRQCLREHRYLLVIDGCERLLRRNGATGEGTSYSATFHHVLDVVGDPEIRSTVVIAGQLRPSDLRDSPLRPIRTVPARRIAAADLASHEPFSGLKGKSEKADLSALCSLLRGHAYGLRLAGEYLKLWRDQREGLEELIGQLADKMRDERLHAMVRILVEALDLPHPLSLPLPTESGSGLTRAFLERLALFLSPVCHTTLELCYKQARRAGCKDQRTFDELDAQLRKTGLLIPIGRPSDTYTVHVTVRATLFQDGRGGVEDSLPAFGLAGFTSSRLGVNPDPASGQQIRELFDAVICRAQEGQDPSCSPTTSQLCRDAYNLVRTRMEANTAPRWCTYQEYLRYTLGVAALAKRITPGKWTYCEYPDAELAEEPDAPLYPAELAWLYNDIALALSAGGYVDDACFFWEQTYEISRLIEDAVNGGSYHLEVLLSLALTSIERGRLPAACQYLDDAERFLHDWRDDDYRARVLGLRGLMAHLQGNLQKASDLYERCLGILRSGNNLRAQSVFSKHLADIKISTQQFGEADMLIRDSRSVAEAGVLPELVANARISEGHRLRRTGHPVQARLEYNAVLSETRRIGFRKLEVRALTALARLALDQKDVDGARHLAMQSLSLANELGLGLRQSHSLVVLGLATLEAGQKDLGIAYLRLAKKMADRQEYWARSREAENRLRELGVPLEEPEDGEPGSQKAAALV